MKKKRQTRLLSLSAALCLLAASGEAQAPLLWPIQGHRSGENILFRPQEYINEELNSSNLFIGAPEGTAVVAPADGTVYFSGYQRAAGNYIIIEHNNGYKTVYMHLSKRHVKKGQKVKLGQLIAKSGNTGRTSGPHLHYEIHVNNRPVDPMKVNLPSAPSKKPLLSQKEQKAFAKTVKKYKADMKSLALIYMPNTEISVN